MKAYKQTDINAIIEFNDLLESQDSNFNEITELEHRVRLELVKQSKYLDYCDNCGFRGILMHVCSETGYKLCKCGNMV